MPAKQRYHHGNLKQLLLDSAVALVAEAGPRAFTLRELARRAHVSHNAPYRHFKDKNDLLAAVAAQGFDLLTSAMTRDMAKGGTALERLSLAGRGYVRFALNWPQHILVMFEAPTTNPARPEYEASGLRAFQILLDAIVAVQAEGGLPSGDPHPFAIVAWAAVHGLAKLAIAGRLPFDARETLRFTDYLTLALSQGMSNLPYAGAAAKPSAQLSPTTPAPARSTPRSPRAGNSRPHPSA
jgi:AcrR family transcriptional regulator